MLLSRTADNLGEGEDTGAINVWMNPSMHNAWTASHLLTPVELQFQFCYILDVFIQVTLRLGFFPPFRRAAIKDITRR